MANTGRSSLSESQGSVSMCIPSSDRRGDPGYAHQLPVPRDVLLEPHFKRIGGSISEQPPGFLDAERAPHRHQVIALDVLDLDLRNMAPDFADQFGDRSRRPVRQVERL